MANCKTVAEVVAVFEKHDLSFLANAMLMFGDQHGDSVIIEGDEFLRIKGDHQVVTNFYQSLTPADKCHCSRYKAAVRVLGKGDPVSDRVVPRRPGDHATERRCTDAILERLRFEKGACLPLSLPQFR